jgi:hypothetical protein
VEGLGDFLENEKSDYFDFTSEKGSLWIREENTIMKNQFYIDHKKDVEEAFGHILMPK